MTDEGRSSTCEIHAWSVITDVFLDDESVQSSQPAVTQPG